MTQFQTTYASPPGSAPGSFVPGLPGSLTGAPPVSRRPGYVKNDTRGDFYVDYKAVDDLRRLMTPNGKIYSRKRLAVSAREQRLIAQAIKRARFMALLPYTSATL